MNQSQIARVRELALQLGVKGLCTHLARRAMTFAPGGRAFRLFLVALEQPRPVAAATEAAKTHTFRFATLEDIERFQQDPASNLEARDVVSFKEGNRCLLQLRGNTLVGYTWISDAPLIELMWGLHFNMPSDMVYNYNGFTVPSFRGVAYQGLRHLKLLEHIKGEGKKRLLGYVDHLNYKSLHGVQKSGYVRIGVLRGVERRGWVHFSLSVNAECWSQVVRLGPRQR
ncbi:MAG: hypothetical protein ACKVPX_16150 [Myxococcaceae bacterium]